MKKISLILSAALAATAAAVPTVAFADDGVAFNVGAVTDYRYRGISQSRLKPALQGGVDYTKGPFYLGAWGSTIKWIKDGGTIASVDTGSSNLEIDLYGGYKGEIAKDLGFDVGGLFYWYPSNKYGNIEGASNANTFEVYGALTVGPLVAKYSHSATNLFGTGGSAGMAGSKHSGYLDISATFDLGSGFSLTPHIGHQEVRHYGALTYNDWSLTLTKDFGAGFSGTAALVGTDADRDLFYTPAGKFTGKAALVVGAKFSF